jgi:hypothetical protein
VPRVRVSVDEAETGVSGDEVRRRLWNGDPRILVLADGPDAFFLTPDTLSASEAAAIPVWLQSAVRGDRGIRSG